MSVECVAMFVELCLALLAWDCVCVGLKVCLRFDKYFSLGSETLVVNLILKNGSGVPFFFEVSRKWKLTSIISIFFC